jgi:hypothetical protein
MRFEDIHEANRKASADLVTELGYQPDDVMDRGDGALDITGRTVTLTIAERDEDGRVRYDERGAITHKERVKVSPERLAAYEEAVTP